MGPGHHVGEFQGEKQQGAKAPRNFMRTHYNDLLRVRKSCNQWNSLGEKKEFCFSVMPLLPKMFVFPLFLVV